MVSEWLGADPGRCGWTADRDREQPAAKPPDHGMVKLQVTGPVTLAIALENFHARSNWAFGIESEGFSEGSYCVRPAEAGRAPIAEVPAAR